MPVHYLHTLLNKDFLMHVHYLHTLLNKDFLLHVHYLRTLLNKDFPLPVHYLHTLPNQLTQMMRLFPELHALVKVLRRHLVPTVQSTLQVTEAGHQVLQRGVG